MARAFAHHGPTRMKETTLANTEGTDQAVTEAPASEQEQGPPEIKASTIDESFVPRPRDTIVGVELDGESVLLEKDTVQVHHLDQIATLVWNSFDGSVSLGELIQEITEAFQADPDVIRNDVISLSQRFGRAGLLEGVRAEALRPPNPNALSTGAEVPSFELPDLEGSRSVALEDYRGRQILLVNWSPSCGFCERIGEELATLEPQLRKQGTEMVFITVGDVEANKEQFQRFGLTSTVLVQESGQLEFLAPMGTPVAYLVDAEGKVAEELAVGADEVPELARTAAGVEEDGQAST
jgi:peroxiredoxin